MGKNIYLVGFMGTGKSTVGEITARKLKRQFVEIDRLIEQRENSRIVDIFAQKGEKYFRRLEKEALKSISLEYALVVSCGGGIVIDHDNILILKTSGKIICLKATASVIYERTKKFSSRPLLNTANPQKKIAELLRLREPFYEQAGFFIDTSRLTPEEVADEIVEIAGNG